MVILNKTKTTSADTRLYTRFVYYLETVKYYLGAYHLLKLKPLDFGKFKGQKVLTGSRCLNESFFDAWSLSWTEDGKKNLSVPKKEFNLTGSQVQAIQEWADEKFNHKHLGWINTFNDLETVKEYQSKFFSHHRDFDIVAIYFPENSAKEFMAEFEPQTEQTGEIGILDCLKQKTPERLIDEEFIGYDLIGMEFSGDYHSFHCYDNADDMINKFGLTLNNLGLIEEFEQKEELLDYANNSENGLPFVPWYLVKVKRVNSTQQRI